jgi:small GTP-binding protein
MHKKRVKVLVVGELAVGKTNLIQTYVGGGGAFTKDYNMTQGAEVSSKVLCFDKQKTDIELFLFEVGGQPLYDSVVASVCKGADFILAVYDCTNENSFVSAFEWYNKVKKATGKALKGCLVGTKCENKTAKEVSGRDAAEKAGKLGLQFF